MEKGSCAISIASASIFVNQTPVDDSHLPALVPDVPVRIAANDPSCDETTNGSSWQKPDGSHVYNTCVDVTPTSPGPLRLTWNIAVHACGVDLAPQPVEFQVQ